MLVFISERSVFMNKNESVSHGSYSQLKPLQLNETQAALLT